MQMPIYRDRGSPPPTRGTPIAVPAVVVKPGITPAYAGNTKSPFLISASHRDHPRLRGEHTDKFKKISLGWDHPRLRGEHSFQILRWYFVLGSPPPTRGTPSKIGKSKAKTGITPAYAGNTVGIKMKWLKAEDHPRLRGEH